MDRGSAWDPLAATRGPSSPPLGSAAATAAGGLAGSDYAHANSHAQHMLAQQWNFQAHTQVERTSPTVGFLPPSPLGDRLLDGAVAGLAAFTIPASAGPAASAAGNGLAMTRNQSFARFDAVTELPLSAHAFPPTMSTEQSGAAQPTSTHQPSRGSFGLAATPPMTVQSSSGRPSLSHGRYHSPGSTPTHSSRVVQSSELSSSPNSMTPPLTDPSPHSALSPRLSMSAMPSTRRAMTRGSAQYASTGSMQGILLPIRSTSGTSTPASASASTSGLKRKAHSTHSMLDLAPPLPLHSGSNSASDAEEQDDDGNSVVAPAPAASASSKKSMGRKSRSEVTLTAAERKQNRLKRKAELARVSRRKKKGHLEETVTRIAQLKEAIAAMEAGEVPPPVAASSAATSAASAAANGSAGLISPSASFANLQLSHSSSTGSMHHNNSFIQERSRHSSSQHQQAKRLRRDSSSVGMSQHGGGGGESDDSDEEDEEDDEDESDSANEDEEDDQHSVAMSVGMSQRMPVSISAPHLSHRQPYSQSRLMRTPPVVSRQHSLSSIASLPSMSPSLSDDAFNLSVFLPRVTPCPLMPVGANDVISTAQQQQQSPGSAGALVQLHRYLQDALKAVDCSVQLDPFEKLLRWVALQASTAPPTPGTEMSAAAAAQASAWSYLASQLDLTPAQVHALRQSRVQTDRLGGDIASLRQELVRVSAGVRGYMSTLDLMQSQLQAAQLQPLQIEHFNSFLHGNAHWLQEQMQSQAPQTEYMEDQPRSVAQQPQLRPHTEQPRPTQRQPQQQPQHYPPPPPVAQSSSPLSWLEQQQASAGLQPSQSSAAPLRQQQMPHLSSFHAEPAVDMSHRSRASSSASHPSPIASAVAAGAAYAPASPPMPLALSSSTLYVGAPLGAPALGTSPRAPSASSHASGRQGIQPLDGLSFQNGIDDSPMHGSAAPPLSLQTGLLMSPLRVPAAAVGAVPHDLGLLEDFDYTSSHNGAAAHGAEMATRVTPPPALGFADSALASDIFGPL